MRGAFSGNAPDSKIACEATDFARQAYPPFLFNHCMRTFWFADRLAASGLRFDRETVYVAAMLHDLGVLAPYDQGRRFEVDGAEAASNFLEGCAYPAEKIEVVWDAIALHTIRSIAESKEPEVALVCIGAVADVAGARIEELDPWFIRELIEQFPRLDFTNAWLQTLFEYVKKNPSRANSTFLEGFSQVISIFANNPLDAE